MTASAYQSVGSATELLATAWTDFTYDEFATVLPLLADLTSLRNYVLQSSAPVVRKATVTWSGVSDADKDRLQGFHAAKTEETLTEEDGTSRPVIVMLTGVALDDAGLWTVSATLLETDDPTPAGS